MEHWEQITCHTDSFQYPFSREKQMCHVIYEAGIINSFKFTQTWKWRTYSRKKPGCNVDYGCWKKIWQNYDLVFLTTIQAYIILRWQHFQHNTFERESWRTRRFNSRCCCSAQAAIAISPRWSKAFRFFISHSIHAWDAWRKQSTVVKNKKSKHILITAEGYIHYYPF